MASVTGLFDYFSRITNNTPFLECVVKVLNEINQIKPIRFDQPKGEASVLLFNCVIIRILNAAALEMPTRDIYLSTITIVLSIKTFLLV